MANSFVAVQAVTADKRADVEELTVAGNLVFRERVQIAGAAATELAVVTTAAPVDWTLPGLHVKVGGMIGSDTVHQQGTYLGMELLAARKDAPGTIATADGRVAPLQLDGEGNLRVSTTALIPGVTATALGKAVDAVAGGTDTGVVGLAVRDDVLAALAPADGDYTPFRVDAIGAQWVTLSDMAQVVGSTPHGTTDTLPPVKIGGRANTTLRTGVIDGQRADALWDVDGALVTRRTAHANIVTGNASNTDGTSTQVIAAQSAGIRTYITDVEVTNTHATQFTYVEIKDGTTVVKTLPVPPSAGVVKHYDPPLRGTAATAWNFDPNTATTTLICSMHGYTSLT